MGANYLKESASNGFKHSSGDERRFSKHVHDNVHGNIYLDPVFPSYASVHVIVSVPC